MLTELAEGGMAILLVEHDVELVMRICEEIYVLDFGRMIAQGSAADVQADAAVQAAYLGVDTRPTARRTARSTSMPAGP